MCPRVGGNTVQAMTSYAVFAEQPLQDAAGLSPAPLFLTCMLFNLGVGLPTFSSTVCGLLWIFFGQCDFTLQGNKKKRKKKRKRFSAQKRNSNQVRHGKPFGPCRWIGGRRYKKCKIQWQLLGKFKRLRMLRHQLTQRMSTCPRQVSGADLRQNDRAKPRQNPLPFFTQTVTWLCGWLGIRVGEASHPGPAGSRASKRKAETQRVVENSSEDSKLAQALLQVLQDFQSSTKEVSQPPQPPNKKGKGGITPPRKPGGSPLARILLQTLQAAITQGCSDQEVATRMVNKITRLISCAKYGYSFYFKS